MAMELNARRVRYIWMFIVPFSAILSSSLLLGESVEITTILGGLITIIAVYALNN